MTAKTLIIVRENADDFDQLRGMLMHEHDPQSALACELVERLAGIIWRLRRVPFFEAAIIDDRQAQLDDEARWNTSRTYKTPQEFDGGEGGAEEMSDAEWSVYVGHALIREGLCGDGLGGLARHETTLMNAFTKTLQMLLLLQENRNDRPCNVMKLEAKVLPPAA